MTVATLDMPVNVAVSVLRNAGTGDNLLAALDALVNTNSTQVEDSVEETPEWVSAVNLESEDENVVTEEVIDF